MTVRSSTDLKAFFETDDVPTEAQFADLIDSYPNSVDIAAATGADLISTPIGEAFDPATQRVTLVASGGVKSAIPTNVLFMNARRYERTFYLSDWSIDYPTNVPLITKTAAGANDILPSQQTYNAAVYDSAPAMYDALTTLFAAYPMTGFELVLGQGFWNLGTQPSGGIAPITTDTVSSATSTTVVLQSGAASNNDAYNGQVVEITAGTGSGQIRRITDYAGSSRTCTVNPAWTTTPDGTSTYVVRRCYILPFTPRATIRSESGNWANTAIIRGANVNSDMFNAYIPYSENGSPTEIKDVEFRGLTVDGGRVYGYQGGTNDADAICPWDVFHWEKPLAWDDSRFRLYFNNIRGAIRHNIFYAARGDSEFRFNRIASSGDSAFYCALTTDIHICDNIFSAAGRHSIHMENMSNVEMSRNQCYFNGQNNENRWDGSTRTSVRENGTVLRIINSNNVRGTDNRLEDSSGHGIWLTSAGDAVRIHNTYFHNLGCLGSFEDNTDGYKDFGFTNLTTSNRNGTDENKHVDGVDCVYFDDVSAGLQNCTGVEITGWVRQVRTNQYTRRLVTIEPVNTRSKPIKDVLIDIQPGYLDTANIPRTILDNALWVAAGKLDFFDQEFEITSSTTRPVAFERCRFNFMGRPMRGFPDRTRNIRSEVHNMYDSSTSFALGTAAVSASITAAAWSQSSSINLITYTVGSDLSGTLTTKHGVTIAGAADAAHNGTFNINAITTTTIQVINMGITDATKDFSGGSATVTGPVAEVVLDDAVDGMTYRIGVASMNGSAEDLVIRSLDENISTTIASVSSKYFAKDVITGWYEVV